MVFVVYNRKFLGPFGIHHKCEFCNANLKNEEVEILEHIHYTGGHYVPMYFCYGHLQKWIKKQQDEFLLNKL
jgi:hypothetical protein